MRSYLHVLLLLVSHPWLGPVASAHAAAERANATAMTANRVRMVRVM